jgi:hypothetical protein
MKAKNLIPLLPALVFVVAGCSKDSSSPELLCTPQLVLHAPAGVLQDVATVTVRVTGPDMDTVTKNLSINGNQATGSVRVPAGESRTFTVEAKDSSNEVLATGSTTRDLEAGTSPTVTISLSISTEVELIYDDGEPASGYYWNTYGNGFGVQMSAQAYPAKVIRLSYYLSGLAGSGSGNGSFTAYVIDYDGWPDVPLTTGIPVTPSSTGWIDVDVSSQNLTVSRDFVVAMIYDGVNTPSLGYDDVDNGRSWDYMYDFDFDIYYWAEWGQTYFIRATVELSSGEVVTIQPSKS